MEAVRETLHQLIDNVGSNDYDLVRQILIRFIPEVEPLSDEIDAVNKADESIAKYGTVSYMNINWD